jgi:hypothetical protein
MVATVGEWLRKLSPLKIAESAVLHKSTAVLLPKGFASPALRSMSCADPVAAT